MIDLIEVTNLGRTFTVRRKAGRLRRTTTSVDAVRDLSFSVAAGEMVGYIGPNGAGKSTTIKMLTGILVPSTGQVRVAGLDPSRRSEEHTSELQSLMRISYAVFCLKKKKKHTNYQ